MSRLFVPAQDVVAVAEGMGAGTLGVIGIPENYNLVNQDARVLVPAAPVRPDQGLALPQLTAAQSIEFMANLAGASQQLSASTGYYDGWQSMLLSQKPVGELLQARPDLQDFFAEDDPRHMISDRVLLHNQDGRQIYVGVDLVEGAGWLAVGRGNTFLAMMMRHPGRFDVTDLDETGSVETDHFQLAISELDVSDVFKLPSFINEPQLIVGAIMDFVRKGVFSEERDRIYKGESLKQLSRQLRIKDYEFIPPSKDANENVLVRAQWQGFHYESQEDKTLVQVEAVLKSNAETEYRIRIYTLPGYGPVMRLPARELRAVGDKLFRGEPLTDKVRMMMWGGAQAFEN